MIFSIKRALVKLQHVYIPHISISLQVTMSTLIIICNTNAKLTSNGKVLTPRGYLNKYKLDGELKA